MIEWAMIKWRGGGLVYRTGQGLSGSDSDLELWEELAAEIARLREQLAAADVKLLDAGHDLRLRDAAIARLSAALEAARTESGRVREELEDLYAYSASCGMDRIREGLELVIRPTPPAAGQGDQA